MKKVVVTLFTFIVLISMGIESFCAAAKGSQVVKVKQRSSSTEMILKGAKNPQKIQQLLNSAKHIMITNLKQKTTPLDPEKKEIIDIYLNDIDASQLHTNFVNAYIGHETTRDVTYDEDAIKRNAETLWQKVKTDAVAEFNKKEDEGCGCL